MAKKIKAPKENKSSFKRSFKRFKNILTLLIFLVFAGFVFYTGWIQIRIPEGSFALIYTKTHGYDSSLVAPGQFIWRWENLFPTNMNIHFIELNTQKEQYSFSSFLPSGLIYGEYINQPDAFKYKVDVEYRFILKETSFSRLIESGRYDTDSLDTLYSEYKAESNLLISSFFNEKDSDELKDLKKMEEDLFNIVSDADLSFQLAELKIKSFSYPDSVLYDKSRALFLEELDTLKDLEFKAHQTAIQIENSTDRKMDLLRQYGQVFSEYPVLLEYFDLDKEKLDPSLFKETEGDSQVR